jgi:DNA repair protein RadC
VIASKTIFIGSLTGALVHPREIFCFALQKHAASIIVSHNHPSGEPLPSNADIDVTQQLVAAGLVLGIDLIDHVVVAKNTSSYFSFADAGLIDPTNKSPSEHSPH